MNTSVLGKDLEVERQKVFFRRFGELIIICDKLEREADRNYIRSLESRIAQRAGTFNASLEQFEWLQDIEQRVKNPAKEIDFSALQEGLLASAGDIIRNDRLPSGRMFMLVELVDRAQRESLNRRDIGLLQYLIIEAGIVSDD